MDERIHQTKPNKKPRIEDEIKVVCKKKKKQQQQLNLINSSSTN
jgi:hypothetical protein